MKKDSVIWKYALTTEDGTRIFRGVKDGQVMLKPEWAVRLCDQTLDANQKLTLILPLLLASIVWSGCGSSQPKPQPGATPTPTPASSAAISISSQVRGMHVQAARITKKTTTELTWPSFFSLPRVEAATTTTVTVAQNWEGECSSSPTVGGTFSFLLFGIGQSQDSTCAHNFFTGDTDGSQIAASAISGKKVFGDGTLSNLVVTTERGTQISSSGVLVSVFIQRGSTLLPTGINCTLPTGGDELACSSTATFAVLTGDKAVVAIVVGDGDLLNNISVAFTKSL